MVPEQRRAREVNRKRRAYPFLSAKKHKDEIPVGVRIYEHGTWQRPLGRHLLRYLNLLQNIPSW